MNEDRDGDLTQAIHAWVLFCLGVAILAVGIGLMLRLMEIKW